MPNEEFNTLKNLFRPPGLMFIVGVILMITTIFNLLGDFSVQNIFINIIPLEISIGLIIGSFIGLEKRT